MAETTPHGQTGASRKQDGEDLLSPTGSEVKNIGLPGQGAKSLINENEIEVPTTKPTGVNDVLTGEDGTPDSLTGAVMENLRVGPGIVRDPQGENDSESEQGESQ